MMKIAGFALMLTALPGAVLAQERVSFPSADGKTALTAYVFAPPKRGAAVPAVVMMHGRGGVYSSAAKGRYDASTISRRHRMWGALWAANGYVAVLVDSFGPRGYAGGFPRFSYNTRPDAVNEVSVRPLDAYGALTWLRARKDIAGDRVGLQGWSNGGSAALASQLKGEDRVVIVFLGDATTEEGVTSETLNFAALKQLPLVFFCENNFYSVQSPLSTRQPPRDIHRWAAAHHVPSVVVDGMNVLAVFEATRAAVERARSGGGPQFIEAPVYRLRAHGGAGDDSQTGYRDPAERDAWETVCPLRLFGDYLDARGLIDSQSVAVMEEAIAAEISSAFDFALSSPDPTQEDLYRHVYAD